MDYYPVSWKTIDVAIEVMAEAFSDDPIVRYISGHPDLPRELYALMMPFYLKWGEVWMNSEQNTVLMCLIPENCTKRFVLKPQQAIRLIKKYGIISFYRALKLASKTAKHRFSAPHYYVFSIGTTMEGRGKGYEGEILRFFMSRGKAEGAILYGENTNPPLNTGLYSYLGFSHTEEIAVTDKGPSFIPTFYNFEI